MASEGTPPSGRGQGPSTRSVHGGERRHHTSEAVTTPIHQTSTFWFRDSAELIAPATFISLAIPLCVFFAFQRYFVQGLLAGSVK